MLSLFAWEEQDNFYMASYAEEFQTLHLIALSLNSKATVFFLEINSSPYPWSIKMKEQSFGSKLKLKYIRDTKSYAALFLKY